MCKNETTVTCQQNSGTTEGLSVETIAIDGKKCHISSLKIQLEFFPIAQQPLEDQSLLIIEAS